jgi:hypothetical protein
MSCPRHCGPYEFGKYRALNRLALRTRYYGGGEQSTVNNRSQPLTSPFVSLHLKGKTDGFVLKGGDASKGSYQTMYDGPRPKPWTKGRHQGSYQPMRKQGAIILATGGDNSNGAEGNFCK